MCPAHIPFLGLIKCSYHGWLFLLTSSEGSHFQPCSVTTKPKSSNATSHIFNPYVSECLQSRPAVPKVWVTIETWVSKGRQMGRAKLVIQICQNQLFHFIFQVLQIRHRLNCTIHILCDFVLLPGLLYHSGFPRVLMATQLLASSLLC